MSYFFHFNTPILTNLSINREHCLSSFDAPNSEELEHKTTVKKKISLFEVNETKFYRVQVKINGASKINSIAKYEEFIPAGFKVEGIFCAHGNTYFDSKKRRLLFFL